MKLKQIQKEWLEHSKNSYVHLVYSTSIDKKLLILLILFCSMVFCSGYMSPEYAIDGLFSVKSDVFSFGVLVLEIVSGKKNRGFHHPDHDLNLVGHVSIESNTYYLLHFETLKFPLVKKDSQMFRHGNSIWKIGLWN